MVGGQVGIVNIVQHLGLAIVDTARASANPEAAREGKASVRLSGRGKVDESIRKDHLALAGADRCANPEIYHWVKLV